ncbi:MAG: hypothetical protein KGO02_12740 [Alphaproteobacteria bacterium]|nr:hypothetical protein [Alphaproteobacteria bacterium]
MSSSSSPRDLINLSANQITTRTTPGSLATELAILPLLPFGGPALFDFSAAAALFGTVVETFSPTYVAAALMLYLPAIRSGEGRLAARCRRVRREAEHFLCCLYFFRCRAVSNLYAEHLILKFAEAPGPE